MTLKTALKCLFKIYKYKKKINHTIFSFFEEEYYKKKLFYGTK